MQTKTEEEDYETGQLISIVLYDSLTIDVPSTSSFGFLNRSASANIRVSG
jgi:hypothetical protein